MSTLGLSIMLIGAAIVCILHKEIGVAFMGAGLFLLWFSSITLFG